MKEDKQDLTLFRVTLDWNASNREEGDYCVTVWAANADKAIRKVAEEMADHEDSGIEPDDKEGREAYIAELVTDAGIYAAESIAAGILNTAQELLAGPERKLSEQAAQDFEAIKAILVQYGAAA